MANAAALLATLDQLIAFVEELSHRPLKTSGFSTGPWLSAEQRDHFLELDAQLAGQAKAAGLTWPSAQHHEPRTSSERYYSEGYTELTSHLRLRAYEALHATEWLMRMRAFRTMVENLRSPGVSLNDSQRTIVEAIRAANRRLTTDQVMEELAHSGKIPSLGTTKNNLAHLVQMEVLNNRKDSRGRGYGLPDWS